MLFSAFNRWLVGREYKYMYPNQPHHSIKVSTKTNQMEKVYKTLIFVDGGRGNQSKGSCEQVYAKWLGIAQSEKLKFKLKS